MAIPATRAAETIRATCGIAGRTHGHHRSDRGYLPSPAAISVPVTDSPPALRPNHDFVEVLFQDFAAKHYVNLASARRRLAHADNGTFYASA